MSCWPYIFEGALPFFISLVMSCWKLKNKNENVMKNARNGKCLWQPFGHGFDWQIGLISSHIPSHRRPVTEFQGRTGPQALMKTQCGKNFLKWNSITFVTSRIWAGGISRFLCLSVMLKQLLKNISNISPIFKVGYKNTCWELSDNPDFPLYICSLSSFRELKMFWLLSQMSFSSDCQPRVTVALLKVVWQWWP